MNLKKKFLKNIIVQQIFGVLLALYIFFVSKTSKIEFINLSIPELFWKDKKPFILAFWHSQLMMISFTWKSPKKINILASSHSDGRFGSIVGKYFKLNNIPVSSKNGNFSIRSIFKKLKKNDYIGITPDGPRGPKEVVSEGIIKIARATETPILVCGYWSSKNFRLKSWDAFLITLPFSSCCFFWQKPLYIPKETNDSNIHHYQKLVKKMIDESIANAKNKVL